MNNGDFGRHNLITHFHCAECGNILKLTYGRKGSGVGKIKKPEYGSDEYNEISKSEPTGGNCRHAEVIQIWPCKHCIEKYTKPSQKLVEAINEINKV